MEKIKVDKNMFCLPWTQTLLGSASAAQDSRGS